MAAPAWLAVSLCQCAGRACTRERSQAGSLSAVSLDGASFVLPVDGS
jgi:hypothetical protein